MSTTEIAPERSGGLENESLMHALRVLRERWWVVALSVLLCAGLAAAYSLTRPDDFRASADVLFNQSQLSDATFGIERGSSEPEREAATQVLVAQSPEVTDRVRRDIRGDESRDDLLDALTVEAAENADVLSFEASAGDPERAAAIANGFARAYVDFSRQTEVRQLDAQIRSLEQRIQDAPEGSTERGDLETRRGNLQSLQAAANGGARLIGSAEAPNSRSSPQPRRDIMLGLIFGLVLGVVLAFLMDLFDRRVRTVEEFEAGYGMRALASIPQISFSARTQEERSVGFEPYRVLRNALGFVELTHDLTTIMVTSAMPSEGKSSVSMNLARAIALSGQRVILVECDLRRPALARHLGIADNGTGLTTALVGRRSATELLQPVSPGLAHLSLLPSGPLPPNAAELLRSPRMGALLAELTADGSRVIIDAPPLLPVADAQGLLDHPQIDGALVVARAYQTTREEVRRSRALLNQHRLQPLGIVVTGLREEKAYGYYGVDPGGVPRQGDGSTPPPVRERATRP